LSTETKQELINKLLHLKSWVIYYFVHFYIVNLVAPSVVKASDNETIVAVGSEFSLICEAAGYPHPTVQWAYNDEPIEEALAGIIFEFCNINIKVESIRH
jgi:hypothetical protein